MGVYKAKSIVYYILCFLKGRKPSVLEEFNPEF